MLVIQSTPSIDRRKADVKRNHFLGNAKLFFEGEVITLLLDDYSLLDAVDGFAGWDDAMSLRLCKHCQKVFMPNRANAIWGNVLCKNQYNVYETRGKYKEQDGDENA